MGKIFFSFYLLFSFVASAQNKKPLDHSVYDGWKSLAERYISNDGNYIVYSINPQEGDGEMIVQHSTTNYKLTISRGYDAVITNDSRYVIFKIKPRYQDVRQARIKKTKTDEIPKDTLAIIELGKDSVIKINRVRSFKMPEKGRGWLAYQLEKPLPDTAKKKMMQDSVKLNINMLAKLADSVIRKSLDSVKGKIQKEEVIKAAQKAVKEIYKKADDIYAGEIADAEADEAGGSNSSSDGTDLIVHNLTTNTDKVFKYVNDYMFDKKGTRLLIETTKRSKDSNSKACIFLYNLSANITDTVMQGFNDAKSYAFDEWGNQLAFLAERDSSSKSLQKFYKLWYYKTSPDSAKLLADKNSNGMRLGMTVSENGYVRFSKDGVKLFFGVAPIPRVKDTSLVDFELARVDVWHYNDDYLQPQQLKQLQRELTLSYLAVIKPTGGNVVQLADDSAENVTLVNEGNADWVLAQSSRGNRISAQWEGRQRNAAYMINTNTGKRNTIAAKGLGFFIASPMGRYVYWYNPELKNYFTWNSRTGVTKNITERIKEPLYDVENDVPDYPGAAGAIGWTADDRSFLVNDVYDIWKVDPDGEAQPQNITNGYGKRNKTDFNYVRLDPEKRFINTDETILLQAQNKTNKYSGFYTKKVNEIADPVQLYMGPYVYAGPVKARDAENYIIQQANPQESELFVSADIKKLTRLTDIAAQQKPYNWYTSELVH